MTDRLQYRMFVAAAALMGGLLLAAPVWDFWHYRHLRGAATRPAFGHAPFAVAGFAPAPRRPVPETAPPAHGPSLAAPEISAQAALTGLAPAASPATKAAVSTVAPPPGVAVQPPPSSAAASMSTQAPVATASPTVRLMPRKRGADSPQAAERTQAPPAQTAPRSTPAAPPVMPLLIAALAPAPTQPAEPAPGAPPPPARESDEPEQPPPDDDPGKPDDSTDEAEEGPAGPMTLWLEPMTRVVAPGQNVIVRVLIDAPQPVASVPFHVVYDPAVVQFVAARQGGAYAGTSLQPILIGGINPDRPGDLAVGLSFVGAPAALGRPAEIVVLEFQGHGAGDSPLVFERASVRDTTGVSLSLLTRPSSISVR